jgi:hypothetical protein
MATPPRNSAKLIKVVVAYLDGRRVRGHVLDFSPLKPSFRLFPEENPLQNRGDEVSLKDLKAVFFVREFSGDKTHKDSNTLEATTRGRKFEVIFRDGESLLGTTEAFNPQKLGFFLFPADTKCNNLRVFVVNQNVEKIRTL